MQPWTHEREVAVQAARTAGAVIAHYWASGVEAGDKGDAGPVTAADLQANDRIRDMVGAAFPDDGWLSEETADSQERLAKRRVWIVDPLDGTRELIAGIPELCVCVSLVVDGAPVVAVQYNPIAERLYVAARGAGTTLNGVPARVTSCSTLADARILASRSEHARGEWDVFAPQCRVVPTGSVAFKLAEVAVGVGDATFTLRPKNEWDVCAGVLLIEEAGGRVTGLDGAPLRFNRETTRLPGMVATNGTLHEAVMRMIAAVES
jgi:myo-inositol-1(or 4)-monophosphatase